MLTRGGIHGEMEGFNGKVLDAYFVACFQLMINSINDYTRDEFPLIDVPEKKANRGKDWRVCVSKQQRTST
jgi:hypothetical protein